MDKEAVASYSMEGSAEERIDGGNPEAVVRTHRLGGDRKTIQVGRSRPGCIWVGAAPASSPAVPKFGAYGGGFWGPGSGGGCPQEN